MVDVCLHLFVCSMSVSSMLPICTVLSFRPVLSSSLSSSPGNCPDGHFSVEGRCISCFCFGITKNCGSTGRYHSQINLRFTDEDDFKGTGLHQILMPVMHVMIDVICP